jgi:ketosteroid isomerase-like protein
MELYAEDAILQLPGVPPISGKPAIRAFYASESDTSTVFEATPGKVEVATSGELAYLLGVKREVCKSAGRKVASEGKVLIVWKKVKGDWLIQAISASSNSPTARGCL